MPKRACHDAIEQHPHTLCNVSNILLSNIHYVSHEVKHKIKYSILEKWRPDMRHTFRKTCFTTCILTVKQVGKYMKVRSICRLCHYESRLYH